MRPIPPKLRQEMSNDNYYKTCCLENTNIYTVDVCFGKIEWHHNLIYAGRQVNEKFCILPLCENHHDNIHKWKDLVTYIMLQRATDEELRQYSKAIDYIELRSRLRRKYEN